MSNLPVIYFHTGNQDYLEISLKLCKQFNEEVILLGNESNREMARRLNVIWENAADYEGGENWERFSKKYIHYSTNPEEFEVICFKRFFVIANLLIADKYRDVQKFIYLDSDILTYVNFSDLEAIDRFDFGMCVPENQDNYGWTANCGISFFSRQALFELVNYFVNTYENNTSMLKEKWDYHEKHSLPGGICDMTLEYLYYRDSSLLKYNLAKAGSELQGVMDTNVNSADNYKAGEYQTDEILGIKKIVYKDEMPYFVDKSGNNVRVFAIHFNGPAKRFMDTYWRNKKCTEDIYNTEKKKQKKQALKSKIKKLLKK